MLIVTNWIGSRHADPYQGARRETSFGHQNLWWGLRCDSFATLSLPI